MAVKGKIKKHRTSDEWKVYDSRGNYLGWTQDRDQALHMAKTGFTNNPEIGQACGNELDLWDTWNSVVSRGRVWESSDGEQIVHLHGDFYLGAKPCEIAAWEVRILWIDDLWHLFGNADGLLEIKVAKKPYHLE